jgi:CP family cyanate transporter-like MFS transporter
LLCGLLFAASVIGIKSSASYGTVFWAALMGATCGAAVALGLALPSLLCRHPDDVARTSAAAFSISFSFAMLISFLSGTAWDMAGKVDAALIPIFLGTLPISILAPTLALKEEVMVPARTLQENDEVAGHGERHGTPPFDRGELETFSVKFR